MINKLVIENLKHRPVRTLLSVIAIGVQVTMVLTLVGLSDGLLEDQQRRARGVGADIIVKAPGSSIIGFTTNMTDKYMAFIEKQPHVKTVVGVLVQGIGGVSTISGLNMGRFIQLSGGFHFVSGRPFEKPDEISVDQYYARQHNIHVGDSVTILNRPWRVSGIFLPGMLARAVVPLNVLQDLTANSGKVTTIYVKLDNAAYTNAVVTELRSKLPDMPIYPLEEFVSLFSVANVPMLKQFIWVVIGLGVVVGFLVVFLSMYTAVLERTREIGVLKALGASPAYILRILLRETAVLSVIGSLCGILMTFGTRWLVQTFAPGALIESIVPSWWPIAAAIAIGGALLGAIYPGLKAARQDAIEALAYD